MKSIALTMFLLGAFTFALASAFALASDNVPANAKLRRVYATFLVFAASSGLALVVTSLAIMTAQ